MILDQKIPYLYLVLMESMFDRNDLTRRKANQNSYRSDTNPLIGIQKNCPMLFIVPTSVNFHLLSSHVIFRSLAIVISFVSNTKSLHSIISERLNDSGKQESVKTFSFELLIGMKREHSSGVLSYFCGIANEIQSDEDKSSHSGITHLCFKRKWSIDRHQGL